MIAFIFPGQGSQRRGMGRALFDEVDMYRELEADVDAIVGYSMRQLCLEDSHNQLNQTKYTQPSLYVVNALYCENAIRENIRPAYLVGHSLGEYNALLAADAFDFLTGLRLVKKRGELMTQARGGAMAAVIGLSPEKIAEIIQESGLTAIDIASINAPTQTVIAAEVPDIIRAQLLFEKAGGQVVTLNVSSAFHSRYVADAAKQFAEFIKPMVFRSPKLAVIANVNARSYPTEDASESIKSLLVSQMTNTVQWTGSIRFLLSLGVSDFIEMGPGNVLTGLVNQIQNDSPS